MNKLLQHKKTIGIITIFSFYILYLWLWINPSLYLIRGYREFFTDGYFFADFVHFPGHLIDYFARFVIQLYQLPAISSVFIGFILLLTYFLIGFVFKHYRWIAFFPVFVLMLMHNDYRHAIRFDLDILAVFLFLNLFILSLRYRNRQSYVAFPLLLSALLYLNGIFSALLLICLVYIMGAFKKEKKEYFLGITIGITIVFLIFHYVFSLSVNDLKQEYTDMSRIYTFPHFPVILYLSVLAVPFLSYLSQSLKKIKGKAVYAVPAGMLFFLLLLFFTSDQEERKGLSVQHYALHGEWERALSYAEKTKYPDKDVVLYTNQALYYTGKMYDDLFLYNQSLGSEGLLSTEITNYSAIVPNQDVFLHLGAISLSIIWGTEATNVYGANPYVLKNLVKAYLAGGYIIEAEKILNQLDRTLFNKKWVKRFRAFVNDTTLISSNTELNTYKQSQAPLAVVSTQNTLMNLFLLMKDSKQNRMAYDYLLVASLLDHKIDYFASYLTGLKEYGYTTIPKLYFEGLVYNSLYSPQSPVNIREFAYDANIMYRFDAFRQDLQIALRDPESAAIVLGDKYEDTYWYYLLFRSSLSNEEKVNILNRLTL